MYVNKHYNGNCELEGYPWKSIQLFFPGRTWHIFLWNIFISLRRSFFYSSWQSKSRRSLCLHYYFISNSNIFFYKSGIISSLWHPYWELDVLTFQWQVNYWRVDQRHQRHVSRPHHPSLSPDYLSACFAPRFFFCQHWFFPQCGAWSQANTARQVYTLQFVCLKKEQIYSTLRLNYWANLFS